MQIAGRNGSEDRQLGRGILVAEDIQRPVVDCRASKMRVVETSSEVSLEFDWFDSGCTLFGPAQSPGNVQASIPCALWSRLGKPPGVEQ